MKIDKAIFSIILIFIIWRICLQLLAYNAPSFLQYKPSFAAPTLLTLFSEHKSVYSWGNFDGVHYITIAKSGYTENDLIQAFFPVYPILMWLMTEYTRNELVAGLIISNFFFICSMYLWYKFFSRKYDRQVAIYSLWFLLIFPTSFFFTSVYSESLFLFLILATITAADKKYWLLASIFAFFVTATRIVGIFIVSALALELFNQNRKMIPEKTLKECLLFMYLYKKELMYIFLSLSGFGLYCLYLYIAFNDPLYFYSVQSKFGGGRENHIILLPQVIWRYLKIIFTANTHTPTYYSAVQEIILSLFSLSVLLLGFLKKYKIPYSWLLFSLSAWLLPTLTGTFSSMPRYILVCFPLFIVLAQYLKGKSKLLFLYSISSIALLIINTIMFIQGYWIA